MILTLNHLRVLVNTAAIQSSNRPEKSEKTNSRCAVVPQSKVTSNSDAQRLQDSSRQRSYKEGGQVEYLSRVLADMSHREKTSAASSSGGDKQQQIDEESDYANLWDSESGPTSAQIGRAHV